MMNNEKLYEVLVGCEMTKDFENAVEENLCGGNLEEFIETIIELEDDLLSLPKELRMAYVFNQLSVDPSTNVEEFIEDFVY